LRAQPEKLEDIRVADDLLQALRLGLLVRQPGQCLLVGGQAAALEILRGDLALEFAHRPVAAQGLDFIEQALERLDQIDELFEVAVGQPGQQGLGIERGRHGGKCGRRPHFL